jgi:hypothetical protein
MITETCPQHVPTGFRDHGGQPGPRAGLPHPARKPPPAERIIAWTATCNGRRIGQGYPGASKNNAWLNSRSAAINLRTLINAGPT